MLQANGQQQQLINELSNKNAQLQQQLQTTEKAVARSEKELAVFHQLQEPGGQQPQLPCSGEHVPREKRASFTNSGDPGVFIGYDDSDPQTYLIGAQEPRRRSG